jgi:hypothetical protein
VVEKQEFRPDRHAFEGHAARESVSLVGKNSSSAQGRKFGVGQTKQISKSAGLKATNGKRHERSPVMEPSGSFAECSEATRFLRRSHSIRTAQIEFAITANALLFRGGGAEPGTHNRWQ